MKSFIWGELSKAEAQKNPHYWASVLGAHCWIGVGLWGVFAIMFDRWSAVVIAPLLYFFLWEVTQLLIARKSITKHLVVDSVLDTAAVACGCFAAAYLRDGSLIESLATWSASIVIAAVGWRVRQS